MKKKGKRRFTYAYIMISRFQLGVTMSRRNLSRNYLRSNRRVNQGISDVPIRGSTAPLDERESMAMARRRVISESLTAEEQSLFRDEMDVAQRISLRKHAEAEALASATARGESEPISDARTFRSYRPGGNRKFGHARGKRRTRSIGRGTAILNRPQKKKKEEEVMEKEIFLLL